MNYGPNGAWETYNALRRAFSDQFAAIDRLCEGFNESEAPLGNMMLGPPNNRQYE
jgi:hypothetical protein